MKVVPIYQLQLMQEDAHKKPETILGYGIDTGDYVFGLFPTEDAAQRWVDENPAK